MNDFKPTKIIKFSETEEFPLYDLNVQRNFILKFNEIPSQIQGQVKENCNRIVGRLEVSPDLQGEPIAIVGYGPTLKRFGSRLASYKNIMSTSGAHNFLLERGIEPTYHAEVDFREHKAVHTKDAHPDVQYILCSICHPKMLDGKKNVRLWHIDIEGITYPEGELVLEGYWDVGQEAILIAKALGYRELHLYGFDYAFEVSSGETHAGFHNGAQGQRVMAQVGNKFFQTSDRFCRGVLAFQKLMADNPDLKLTLFSDGLLSAYLKFHNYSRSSEGGTPENG